MGGRGTFALGKNVAYSFETVGKINGVKVLEKKDKNDSKNLPEEAHSSKAYILLDDNGVFRKYREYDKHHIIQFEIEYGTHGARKFLHYHPYINGERQKAQEISSSMIEKYKKFFKGLNLWKIWSLTSFWI